MAHPIGEMFVSEGARMVGQWLLGAAIVCTLVGGYLWALSSGESAGCKRHIAAMDQCALTQSCKSTVRDVRRYQGCKEQP